MSGATECETPLGTLQVDQSTCDELLTSGLFEPMTAKVDEDEHSIEMHLPYIAKSLNDAGRTDIPIVPIMVGALAEDVQVTYGTLLAPYLANPENFFVVSSDFCHWGAHFSYQPFDDNYGKDLQVWEYIKAMDHEGMEIIERQDLVGFNAYLRRTKNTVCGRYPISVLLASLAAIKASDRGGGGGGSSSSASELTVKFIAYDQSAKASTRRDSSVSYAAALVCE